MGAAIYLRYPFHRREKDRKLTRPPPKGMGRPYGLIDFPPTHFCDRALSSPALESTAFEHKALGSPASESPVTPSPATTPVFGERPQRPAPPAAECSSRGLCRPKIRTRAVFFHQPYSNIAQTTAAFRAVMMRFPHPSRIPTYRPNSFIYSYAQESPESNDSNQNNPDAYYFVMAQSYRRKS